MGLLNDLSKLDHKGLVEFLGNNAHLLALTGDDIEDQICTLSQKNSRSAGILLAAYLYSKEQSIEREYKEVLFLFSHLAKETDDADRKCHFLSFVSSLNQGLSWNAMGSEILEWKTWDNLPNDMTFYEKWALANYILFFCTRDHSKFLLDATLLSEGFMVLNESAKLWKELEFSLEVVI